MKCSVCGQEFGNGAACQNCGVDRVTGLANYSGYDPSSQGNNSYSVTQSEPSVSQPHIKKVESIICHACGEIIPADSKFCPYCSTSLWVQCPKCGKTYSSQFPACSECGTNRKSYLESNTDKMEFMKKYRDRMVVNPDGTITIPPNAFESCDLGKVTLPDLVRKIGIGAFSYSSLVSIIIPSGVERIGARAFEGCNNLQTVVIPDSVTTIGMNCFRGCKSLQIINIPDSLVKIAENAFSDCDNLNENCKREIESRYNK